SFESTATARSSRPWSRPSHSVLPSSSRKHDDGNERARPVRVRPGDGHSPLFHGIIESPYPVRKHHRPSPAPSAVKGSRPSRAKLDAPLVRKLADMFGMLSSPTRLRSLHAMAVAGELHVNGVAAALRMRVT